MLLGGEYKDVTFEFNVMDPKKPVITTVGWEVVVRDSYVHERDVMYANFFTITTKVMIQDLDTKINYVSRKVQTAQDTLLVQLKTEKTEEKTRQGCRGAWRGCDHGEVRA